MKRLLTALTSLLCVIGLLGCNDRNRQTLDKVVELSAKGEDLTWSDFERYESKDVGSGLYIYLYDIDDTFGLWIGGVPSDKPIYMRLATKADMAVQQEVLSRMAGLIEEERDYEDKGNYGHFCNILPTIAIDDVLQRNGKTPEEAFELISTHMWAALNPEGFRKLSKLPFFLSVMRKINPLGFKYGSGKGWKSVWHEDPEWELSLDMVKCPYHEKCIALFVAE